MQQNLFSIDIFLLLISHQFERRHVYTITVPSGFKAMKTSMSISDYCSQMDNGHSTNQGIQDLKFCGHSKNNGKSYSNLRCIYLVRRLFEKLMFVFKTMFFIRALRIHRMCAALLQPMVNLAPPLQTPASSVSYWAQFSPIFL